MSDLATSRAQKTAGFAGKMQGAIVDLEMRKNTFLSEIQQDEDAIYQLKLEIAICEQMSAQLQERIQRREVASKEFDQTLERANMAGKKLKQATQNLGKIVVNV